MLDKLASQLGLTSSEHTIESFFDQVIFCTNVTYADGGFKGGKSSSADKLALLT